MVLKEKLQWLEREKHFHTPKMQVGITQAEGWDVTTLLASPTQIFFQAKHLLYTNDFTPSNQL